MDSAAVAQDVAALYETQVAPIYADMESPSEKAAAVLAELGDYALSAIPEGYYLYSISTFDEEDSKDSMWADMNGGGLYAEVNVTYTCESVWWYGLDDIHLQYTRYWADEDKSECINREQFENGGMLLDTKKSLGAADCQVGQCEGWYYIDDLYNAGRIYLYWLDTENELVFNMTVPGSYTLEEAIAMAASVTAQ